MGEGDLVSIVGIDSVINQSETNSVPDERKAFSDWHGHCQTDHSVDCFADQLCGFDGRVHHGVNVKWAWSFRGGGNKPIHVDPKQVPDRGINDVGKMVPSVRAWLMIGVCKGATSQISNGFSGPLDQVGSS